MSPGRSVQKPSRRLPSVASSDVGLDIKIIRLGDRWNQPPAPVGSQLPLLGISSAQPLAIISDNQFMCHSASTGPALPSRVRAYVEAIVSTCADGGRALASVVVFGSAAIGGWVETVSDVDLILVVPDRATQENRDHLRDEVERLETLHQFRNGSPHIQGALDRVIDKVAANVRSFFIGDLLSGSIGRILGLRPSQALFVDRVVLANIVVSG